MSTEKITKMRYFKMLLLYHSILSTEKRKTHNYKHIRSTAKSQEEIFGFKPP